jgi:hypothetical protein
VQQIGIGNAFRAVDLRAVIHAAGFRPTPLGHANHTVFKLKNDDLASDPSEKKDLATGEPKRVAAMTPEVAAWQKSCKASDSQQDYKGKAGTGSVRNVRVKERGK